jgi:serine O-acetyltransferase
MKDPISTHWLPINSKEALQFYLKADKLALGIEKRTITGGITDALRMTNTGYIWQYQRQLREAEYFYNCKTSLISKSQKLYRLFRLNRLAFRLGFAIPLNVFGPGLSIVHHGTILVNGNARIGANCNLHNLVHIARKTGYSDASPTIGDNVFIGPGARVLGGIIIADGTIVGANSVVTKAVLEPNTTVAGAPARKISERGTQSFWRPGQRDALVDYIAANKERFSEQ